MKMGIIIFVIIMVIIILSIGYLTYNNLGSGTRNGVNKTVEELNKTSNLTSNILPYRLATREPINNISDKYDYLRSFKPTPIIINSSEAQIVAISNKKLSQDEFETIINDLIREGYIYNSMMMIGIYIKDRKIEEDVNRIQIKDSGEMIVYNDVPYEKPGSWKYNITLNYIYYKDGGDIGLESEISFPEIRGPI